MSTGAGFITFLSLTLALLGAVVAMGKLARRAAHITLVVLALGSLGVTIFFAEKLGELYDLESAGAITPVHLFLAKLTVVSYVLPVCTGIWTVRNKERALAWHRRAAYSVLALTVLTAITGTCMVLAAERI